MAETATQRPAEAGHIGFAVCNTDSFARLHDGAPSMRGAGC